MTKYNEISKPEHYNHGNYEVLDIIKDQLVGMPISAWEGYLLGNIIKYLLRFPYKGKSEQDLGKAKYYLSCLINEYDLKAGYSDEDIKGFMTAVANADKEYDDALNYRASKAKEGEKGVKEVKDTDSDVAYGHSSKKEKGVKDVKDTDSDVGYGHNPKEDTGLNILDMLSHMGDYAENLFHNEKEDSKNSEDNDTIEGIDALAKLLKGIVGEPATENISSDNEEEIIKSYDTSLSILKYLTDTVKDLEDSKDDKKDKDDSVEDDYSYFVLKPKTISTLKEILENNNSASNVFLGFDLSYNRKNLIDLIHDLKADEYEVVLFDELIAEVLDVVSVEDWTDDSTEAFVVQLLFKNLTTSILSDLQDSLSEEE